MADKEDLKSRVTAMEVRFGFYDKMFTEIKDTLKSIDDGFKQWRKEDQEMRERNGIDHESLREELNARLQPLWLYYVMANHPFMTFSGLVFILSVIEYIPELRDFFLQ